MGPIKYVMEIPFHGCVGLYRVWWDRKYCKKDATIKIYALNFVLVTTLHGKSQYTP